jgi:hypothetical protein
MPFRMQDQLEELWCWAAVSASIAWYYSAATPWTQCEVASSVLRGRACDDPRRFNRVAHLHTALRAVKKFRKFLPRKLNVAEIRAELALYRPIGVLILWRDGTGHFVVIEAIRERGGVEILSIADPLYGSTPSIPYEEFCTAYRGSGRWTQSFLVDRHGREEI